MPTKRTRRSRRRTRPFTADTIGIRTWLRFMAGWHPEMGRRTGDLWTTWRGYLEAYVSVREGLLADDRCARRDEPPLAERLLAVLQSGVPVEEAQGHIHELHPAVFIWGVEGLEDARAIATAAGAPDFIATVRDWVPANGL